MATDQDKKDYHILVIEDNRGDFTLVEDFLLEQFATAAITHAPNYQSAKEVLSRVEYRYDIILLDLSLPDQRGEPLIRGILERSADTPVIVLTGYADIPFGVKSLSMGVSDYILKEELTSLSLYKSIIYSSERKKIAVYDGRSEKNIASCSI